MKQAAQPPLVCQAEQSREVRQFGILGLGMLGVRMFGLLVCRTGRRAGTRDATRERHPTWWMALLCSCRSTDGRVWCLMRASLPERSGAASLVTHHTSRMQHVKSHPAADPQLLCRSGLAVMMISRYVQTCACGSGGFDSPARRQQFAASWLCCGYQRPPPSTNVHTYVLIDPDADIARDRLGAR